jgi:riboflavin biosynthesis pyrimidine reductase
LVDHDAVGVAAVGDSSQMLIGEVVRVDRIRRLLLEGGGHINGAFLQAGLVDEISLLLVPGVDSALCSGKGCLLACWSLAMRY